MSKFQGVRLEFWHLSRSFESLDWRTDSSRLINTHPRLTNAPSCDRCSTALLTIADSSEYFIDIFCLRLQAIALSKVLDNAPICNLKIYKRRDGHDR